MAMTVCRVTDADTGKNRSLVVCEAKAKKKNQSSLVATIGYRIAEAEVTQSIIVLL